MGTQNGDMLSSMVAAIMRDIFPKYEYHGIYRYQVFQVTDQKLELQALKKRPGLPDILPVEMFPGLAGAYSEVKAGSTALLMFADGDPSQPTVVGFAPVSEGNLHYPETTIINAQTSIDIGKDNLDNPVKWTGFQTFAAETITAITALKADLVATALLCQPGGGVVAVSTATTPSDPTGQATKVRVE